MSKTLGYIFIVEGERKRESKKNLTTGYSCTDVRYCASFIDRPAIYRKKSGDIPCFRKQILDFIKTVVAWMHVDHCEICSISLHKYTERTAEMSLYLHVNFN